MSKHIIIVFFLFSQALTAMKLELLDRSKRHVSIQDESSQERPFLSRTSPRLRRAGDVNRVEISAYEQAKTYRTELFSTLPIAQIHKSFGALPDECKRFALATMSTRMLMMHAVGKILPTDVIKQILFFMLDGNMQAAEKFYNKPIGKAFELYHRIKYNLNDDVMPIGPLYAQSKINRDFVFQAINPEWYYSQPIITIGDQEKIVAMSKDMQQYFSGKKVKVLPKDRECGCMSGDARSCLFFSCIVPVASLGFFCGLGAIVGAILGKNLAIFLCAPEVLVTNLGASSGVAVIGCSVTGPAIIARTWHHTQEVTL